MYSWLCLLACDIFSIEIIYHLNKCHHSVHLIPCYQTVHKPIKHIIIPVGFHSLTWLVNMCFYSLRQSMYTNYHEYYSRQSRIERSWFSYRWYDIFLTATLLKCFSSRSYSKSTDLIVAKYNIGRNLCIRLFHKYSCCMYHSVCHTRSSWIYPTNARVSSIVPILIDRDVASIPVEMVWIIIVHNWWKLPRKICIGNVLPKIIAKVYPINSFLFYPHLSLFIYSDNRTRNNYTTQFLGIQYFVDLAIIQYVTNIAPSVSSVRFSSSLSTRFYICRYFI